jgi:HNH endonuclease
MRKAISKTLRQKVAVRANFHCEYCLLDEKVSFYVFHIEHIKSIKHGGTSDFENLGYGCPDCNFAKGSDVGTFDASDENIVRFFNPRKDNWAAHFEIQNGAILGKTPIGEATVKIFKFNEVERLIFRQQLLDLEV